MSALISSLIGFGSSLLPEVCKYFQNKQENEQTLKIMELQIEREKLGLQARAEEIQMQADAAVMQASYQTGNSSGVKWVQGFADLIRPLLALLVMIDYITVNYTLLSCVSFAEGLIDLPEIAHLLWNEEDANGFIIVMTYYFGRLSYKSYQK